MDRSEYDMRALHAMIAIMFLSGTLRGSETRVLDAIVIATFLECKDRARISGANLARLSGLNRTHLVNVIKSLTQLGYLLDDEGAWRLDLELMQEHASAIRAELFPNAA